MLKCGWQGKELTQKRETALSRLRLKGERKAGHQCEEKGVEEAPVSQWSALEHAPRLQGRKSGQQEVRRNN